MKRIILFFTVCLGLSVSRTTFADNSDVARAASKRTQTPVSTTTNQNSNRAVNTNSKESNQKQTKNARTAVQPKNRVTSRTPVITTQQSVKQRTASVPRVAQQPRTLSSRVAKQTKNESVSTRTNRSATTTPVRQSVRSAEINTEKLNNIKSLNYTNCKNVYYECMDEFCANKDADLRRCACSTRIHEFDNIKKQLNDAEDKMLDFNQRLLTVGLDKEDATAINVATDGELAFQKTDKSESEKLLQKITNSLNLSSDSKMNNDLSAISLSLDFDNAWNDIDAMSGISTTSKSGTQLYNAAHPICIEMAKEVCNDEEIEIVQNGYKLAIEQDCNTVSKSYTTKYNKAMEKIHESGALLDMARLNIYQQRNSDDTLTCKKKILEQLSDESVCGENLYKCLDMTGQYIDPSTGDAFLSGDLYNLANLLHEPDAGEKWSTVGQNEKFVNFLNSKKAFLEPAIEQCQDISDMIWKDFIDDALSQIKLAQNSKLEEIKQSCITLISECRTSTLTDLSDFDARAISTFAVMADKTANKICADVQNSCVALMDNIGTSQDWSTGITQIAADLSYNTIIETCKNIGQECIIQQCHGINGNFALCQKTTSTNRISVLTSDTCWNKVYECVAGADNLDTITKNITDDYVTSMYPTNTPLFSRCDDKTDKLCLLTEQIWGNCEYKPGSVNVTSNKNLISNDKYKQSNKILIPRTNDTILSWFATNTGTTSSVDSCLATGCPYNYELKTDGTCNQLMTKPLTTTDDREATSSTQFFNVTSNITNYCETTIKDFDDNCCDNGYRNNNICVKNESDTISSNSFVVQCPDTKPCNEDDIACNTLYNYYCPGDTTRTITLYCIGSVTTKDSTDTVTTGFQCNGTWILVDEYGNYFDPAIIQDNSFSQIPSNVSMSYKTNKTNTCKYEWNTTYNEWKWNGQGCEEDIGSMPTTNKFMINYD